MERNCMKNRPDADVEACEHYTQAEGIDSQRKHLRHQPSGASLSVTAQIFARAGAQAHKVFLNICNDDHKATASQSLKKRHR